MKNTRKILSFVITLAIIITTVSVIGLSVSAQQTAQSVYWSYDNSTDTLTISDTPANGRQEFTVDAQRLADVYTMPWNIAGKWYSNVKTVVIDGKPRPASTDQWFANDSKLTQIVNLKNLDTSCVESMSSMFNSCSKLTSIDVSAFNTSKVTSFFAMFAYCYNLTQLDVSSFDVSGSESFASMFYHCNSLEELDVSGFQIDFENSDFLEMFAECEKLETLYLFSINNNKLKQMEGVFGGCSSLKTIYAPCSGDLSNILAKRAFYGCENLVGDLGSSYSSYGDAFDMFCFDGGEDAPGYISKMHSLTKHDEVPATCTADGTAEYYSCSDCGKLFSDEGASNEISVPDTIFSNGHTPGEKVMENEVAATCTAGGSYDEVVYCTTCGNELERNAKTVDANGHADSNNDGKCDFCNERMTGEGRCEWCGKIHNMNNPLEIATATVHNILHVCVPFFQKMIDFIFDWFSSIK